MLARMFARARRMLIAAAAGVVLAAASWGATAWAAGEGPVVVELFTSQGCNTCPPADRLLGELAEREDVIALSLHVDYWDYIGWEDPYGRPENTERQRAYVDALDARFLYTPQMVVDGRAEMVGSHRGEVERTIEAARRLPKPVAPRFVGASDGGPKIVVPAGQTDRPATVWLAVYDRAHETQVPRGENAGRRLVNRNVVRELKRVGTWTGERAEFPIDPASALAAGRDSCAVLVQEAGHGRILGAAAMPLGALSGG